MSVAGAAGGVEQAEVEAVWGGGGDGSGAVPDHGVAVRELVGRAEESGVEWGGGGFGVLRGEGRGGKVGGDVDGGEEGLREAGFVDNVAIELVMAGRHGGERQAEVAGGDESGVEVEGGVHLGLADGVQVDELAVVRDVVVVGAGSGEAGWDVLSGGLPLFDQEIKLVAGESGGSDGSGVYVACVAGGFDVPPLGSEEDCTGHEDEAGGHGDEAAAAGGWVGRKAGAEAGFSERCGDDASHGDDEEQAEDCKANAHAGLHVQSGDGDGKDRDGRGFAAGGAVGFNADLPGSGGHDPDTAGVEGRIVCRLLHGVRSGWVLGGLAGEWEWGDVEGCDGRTG